MTNLIEKTNRLKKQAISAQYDELAAMLVHYRAGKSNYDVCQARKMIELINDDKEPLNKFLTRDEHYTFETLRGFHCEKQPENGLRDAIADLTMELIEHVEKRLERDARAARGMPPGNNGA